MDNENRVIKMALEMIDGNKTVRQVAKIVGYSKSTVHNDLTTKLENIDISKQELTKTTEITTLKQKENEKMTVTIKVQGMMCPHCEARVKKVCEAIDGVVSAAPSHEQGEVVLEMTNDVSDACRAAIIDAGYEA